jgi:hypothetical protein
LHAVDGTWLFSAQCGTGDQIAQFRRHDG